MSGTAGMANGRSSTFTDLGRPPSCPIEGPGWGHCSAEIYSSSVECGCWFSHLDFAGIPHQSPHYHRHYHLHTCIEKACLFTKVIMSSEQMTTSPRLLLPVPLSVLCQGRASSALGAMGAGPEDPPAGWHWPGLPWLEARMSSYVFTRGWGEEGAELEGMWHRPTLSLISPLLGVPLGRADEPPTP